MNTKEILQEATKIICEFEGFREYAYKDSAGVWTIGYGQTNTIHGGKIHEYQRIKKEEALYFVQEKVEKIYYNIMGRISIPLQKSQYIALISLIYNIGESAFNRSILLKKINREYEIQDIKKEWLRWSYVKGIWNKALYKRRVKEFNIYISEKQSCINFDS
ncbi:lysozyme [Riemerella columbipharyngis]|uniref:Lysozyme n=1 Tax=Riemerella columbipharyngis TaxID=1071918 RepID=A0A1G6ZEY4_9FLAO|nr:lysozyme [Riemerella columbipharyngis]SDE01194.1 lysozyme [Riemerella columbipharyngis]SDE01496.1 lysozyme [Riemerella columbipharyngis]